MIDEGPAYDPFPFVQALRGLHYLCQHAGKSPCSRKAKYPGMCASDASFIRKVNPLISLTPYLYYTTNDLSLG